MFCIEKPGKSKFAPSIGGRKAQTSTPASSSTAPTIEITDSPASSNTVTEEENSHPPTTVAEEKTTSDFLDTTPSTVGKKIESVQSRRSAQKDEHAIVTGHPLSHQQQQQQVKLPSGPKDAASIATSTSSTGMTTEKRTMSYFLKDSGEGKEMPGTQLSSSASASSSDAGLSPSKTRRIVNLRNIKAPPRSAATSTAMAPQVRVVDGAIVYDEKFSAAINMASNNSGNSSFANLEQELEYIDEDDENGKHLTSATYSTKAKGSNRWNQIETDLFYEALSMCGTDFSIIQTLFPHRTRSQIKGKYKLEEKANPARINNSLKSRRAFDPNFRDRVKEFNEKKQTNK